MSSSSEESYKETKRIKQGQEKLSPAYQQLAHWIQEKYNVQVLNIRLEHPEVIQRPRLHVILEYLEEAEQFNEPDTINYDAKKQEAIARAFQRICQPKEDCANFLVIFTAFAPAAREEANMAIPTDDLQALKERLNLDEL
jgi:hypothetical protein